MLAPMHRVKISMDLSVQPLHGEDLHHQVMSATSPEAIQGKQVLLPETTPTPVQHVQQAVCALLLFGACLVHHKEVIFWNYCTTYMPVVAHLLSMLIASVA